MTIDYPTYDECVAAGYTPEPMLFDQALAAHGLRVAPFATARSQVGAPRKHIKREFPLRTYASKYIGVTRCQGRWCAQWKKPNGVYKRGPLRETELQAARDRAKALGKEELEVRA